MVDTLASVFVFFLFAVLCGLFWHLGGFWGLAFFLASSAKATVEDAGDGAG